MKHFIMRTYNNTGKLSATVFIEDIDIVSTIENVATQAHNLSPNTVEINIKEVSKAEYLAAKSEVNERKGPPDLTVYFLGK